MSKNRICRFAYYLATDGFPAVLGVYKMCKTEISVFNLEQWDMKYYHTNI